MTEQLELELAIRYFKKRTVSTLEVNNKFMRQLVSVISAREVEAVLEMVKNGEFSTYYNKMKEQGHPAYT